MSRCVRELREWTGKASTTIIYDSTVDEFTGDGLFIKVKDKPNITVIGFTTDGDVCGGFYSVAVTKQEKLFYDPSIFAFSFESHGRCETPQRFAVKESLKGKANVEFFWNNSSLGFVRFWVEGVGCFWLGNERSYTCFSSLSDAFEGLEDTTLTGQTVDWIENGPNHCARLVAVQLE